jgi:sugar O-acyltransferase (sialic acid O-acetyltransferase NeuD family)
MKLNRNRMRFYDEAKARGYALANYVSSRAFVWPNVRLGDNVFIFENNVVQPFVEIGSNVVLWSGNHIGHHSRVGSHCFISSHVVVSGFCDIGEACFFGVNSTVGNNVKVGRDCLVGAGALVVKDTGDARLFKGPATAPEAESTLAKFGIA